ncbi:hypothetical protein FA15DRAFT_666291 [Coprinopsis marcescibilis]|uniref:Uncharacterized protein n=1 Tax=Coprinopsis marcescibilis TaxID=230819 RepID=A0A5C3L4F4_COPMA|nr:hypothetical protein FA15DRAFT_666291 [Coprinopsis marcescibilis]
MPTTRRQTAIKEGKLDTSETDAKPKPKSKKSTSTPSRKQATDKKLKGSKGPTNVKPKPSSKRNRAETPAEEKGNERSAKTAKVEEDNEEPPRNGVYKVGTIERGHIYFFYRPKVELEEAHSIDEVKNFHILLIPRPPIYEGDTQNKDAKKAEPSITEEVEMKVLSPGADADPAPVTRRTTKQHYRLLTVGKKKLPDPHGHGPGNRKETFWATVTSLGDDLNVPVEGLGPKEYETKTRGTRHQAAARLVARGGYAIVNTNPRLPSQRETHLGYHVSHPSASDMGDVQKSLGIFSSSSFVIQVKNPLAPNTGPRMSASTKEAEYPEWIMKDVFGAGGSRGREEYGLRFASCETPELLDYLGAQLLLIASRDGEQGLEVSLGENRGEALIQAENEDAKLDVGEIFKELGLDPDEFSMEAIEGEWA